MKKIVIAGVVIVLLELALGFIYLNNTKKYVPEAIKKETVTTEIKKTEAEGAQIILSTGSTSVTVGDAVEVRAQVRSKEVSDAADLSIKYDPALLKVKSESAPFILGSAYQKVVFNLGNSKIGVATMSAVSDVSKPFSGEAELGSISFVALKAGEAKVLVNFRKGETRDTNVVVSGTDILQSVKDLTFQINP